MPQAQLPLFPAGSTPLNAHLGFACRDGQVTYFNGQLPVFCHAENDRASFRLFTSQLVANGSATSGEIQRAFGVPKVAVQRALASYRAHGTKVFFAPPPPRRGRKLTPEVLARAQTLLDQGDDVPKVADQTEVLANTIHKAIRAGRLRRPATGVKKKTPRPPRPSPPPPFPPSPS
jgi:transposase